MRLCRAKNNNSERQRIYPLHRMSKVCLVTGSSGLIGSEVTGFFHENGFTVHGVDNNQRETFFGPQGNTAWNQPAPSQEPDPISTSRTGHPRSGRGAAIGKATQTFSNSSHRRPALSRPSRPVFPLMISMSMPSAR